MLEFLFKKKKNARPEVKSAVFISVRYKIICTKAKIGHSLHRRNSDEKKKARLAAETVMHQPDFF